MGIVQNYIQQFVPGFPMYAHVIICCCFFYLPAVPHLERPQTYRGKNKNN